MSFLTTLYKYHKLPLLLFALSVVFYLSFAYDLVRTNTTKLLLFYTILVVLGYFLIKSCGFHLKLLIISAFVFRLLFLFAIPNLSQDFYRFIWDGRLILEGINPYLFTPQTIINSNEISISGAQQLYEGMGELSASHFSNYPPLHQLCFTLASLIGGKSIWLTVIGLRLFIILADLGILYYGIKILDHLKLPRTRIFWYLLNPFIIIELTGNLHFEAVMIFFMVWSFYLLFNNKWKLAAIVLGLSISVKLLPLILFPLFIGWFYYRNTSSKWQALRSLILFYTIVLATLIVTFLPFLSNELIGNYSQTMALWFNDFEFNASVYYVLREIGYTLSGYNQIALIGTVLSMLSFLSIIIVSLVRKNNNEASLLTSMLFVLTIYLVLSTTVHPWYLSTLVILAAFQHYKYPFLWSALIILSYTAYANQDYAEELWVVAIEYLLIYAFIIYELFIKSKTKIIAKSISL
ncbi:MAG: mannosyltransferase [Winogradskyella sp.]|nr:mannosyltransferase [Winogradskyella sp.]